MAMSPHSRPARPRRWPAWSAWALWALAVLGLVTVPWFDHLLRQAHRPELTQLGASAIPYLLAVVIAATVGALLASRRPRHPVGWLLLALALSVTASGVADGYALWAGGPARGASRGPVGGRLQPRDPVHGAGLCGLRVAADADRVAALAPLALVGLGGCAAAPAGWLVALTVGPGLVIPPYKAAVEPVAVPALAGAVRLTIAVAFVLTVGGLAVGAWSLVVRFSHARGIERQQLRWIAFAAALTGVAAAVVLAGMALGATVVLLLGIGVCLAILPLATGAAVLRYRLFDLDRIISRTLAYGLLTLLLAGGYAVVALALGQLLGQDSSLAVAGATLTVAAAFQPVRRRIQQTVDRRFNRRRHDAARIIEAFGVRLRDQVDLDALHGELLAVVDQTMQPTQASLWLRLRPPGRPPAIGPWRRPGHTWEEWT